MQTILKLLVPGWGQFRNGQPGKAFTIAGVTALVLGLACVTPWLHSLRGLVAFLIVLLGGMIAATVDARRHRTDAPTPVRPRQAAPLLLLPILIAAALAIEPMRNRLFGIAVYRIPSHNTSSAPTLVGGDRLVASMRARSPERGRLVLFRAPGEGDQIYVKRLVALPGDIVRADADGIFVNDRRIASGTTEPLEPVRVPDGCFFALGDNVANSRDSRNFGPVGIDAIIGHPLYVVWSGTCNRIGTCLDSPTTPSG